MDDLKVGQKEQWKAPLWVVHSDSQWDVSRVDLLVVMMVVMTVVMTVVQSAFPSVDLMAR
jgi:hypothetical protein